MEDLEPRVNRPANALGADDNASGIAAIMELAQFCGPKEKGELNLKRDIIFGAWSGERMGLWIKNILLKNKKEEKRIGLSFDHSLFQSRHGWSTGW